jgi:hypothetical protein
MEMAMQVTALDGPVAPVELQPAGEGTWRTVAAVAGALFLSAMLLGSEAAPDGPALFASRLRVHEYFVAHSHAALNQSFVLDGLAGVALVVLTVALWRSFAGVPRGRAASVALLGAGLAAAAASFVQLVFMLRIERHITREVGVRRTDFLFDAMNRTGSAKLVLLAIAVGAACVLAARSDTFPRWVRWVGYALVPVLGFGALASVVSGPTLATFFALSLPLLMLWVAATSLMLWHPAGRRSAHMSREVPSTAGV